MVSYFQRADGVLVHFIVLSNSIPSRRNSNTCIVLYRINEAGKACFNGNLNNHDFTLFWTDAFKWSKISKSTP